METRSKETGCLVLVCGLPGSGKTTLARGMAQERRGVRLSPDEWMDDLGANLWDSAMRERVEALQWRVAKDLLVAGVTVVVEWGTWARSERDQLRRDGEGLGARTELVYLDVPTRELWRRIQERAAEDPPVTWEDLEGWVAAFEEPDEEELALYDSGTTLRAPT